LTRFEDIPDDYSLQLALENVSELVRQVRRLQDKLKILQTAITKIGCAELDVVEPDAAAYRYIPLSLDEFFETMFDLEGHLAQDPDYRHTDLAYRPCSFIEVGCGVGRNIYLLSATTRFHFDKIVGFDIVEAYVAAGQKYFGLGSNLFFADCLTFDYGGYDIIYFYRPFVDDDKQKLFETRLIDTSKVGAYIIGSGSEILDESRRLIRKDDGRRIWKRV
jgi:SAM-dependent methyltransferase